MSKFLITGATGFVGSATARKLLELKHDVLLLDRLAPRDKELQKYWPCYSDISQTHDIFPLLNQQAKDVDIIIHCAAQTAVTQSFVDPICDFKINALGTLNLLAWIRESRGGTGHKKMPLVIFMSTNKIYGSDTYMKIEETDTRYQTFPMHSTKESDLVDAVTPYAVSKRCAEMYVQEYSRSFGLHTCILRCSCIYGETQKGSFDQGWISWIISQAVKQNPITVCGNGKQVRDCLHIDDLIELYLRISERHVNNRDDINRSALMNVGGGNENTISILELLDMIKEFGIDLKINFENFRPYDQRYYVSNIQKAFDEYQWSPQVGAQAGIQAMIADRIAKSKKAEKF